MIFALTGENSFAVAEAERQLAEAFIAKHGAHGIEYVDGETLQAHQLPDLLHGAVLFSPKRLVLLRNIASNKSVQEALVTHLQSVTPDTTVVINEPALDKRTKLYAFLKARATFKNFVSMSRMQLRAWVIQRATNLGVQLAAPEADYLIERAGEDQWRLANELEKLASYQPVVTQLAVDQLVEPVAAGTAFDVLDATLAGDRDRAKRLLAGLRWQEDPYRFLGLLISQVHTIAVIAAADGQTPDQIAKQAGLHPFVVRKNQALARRLLPGQVAHMAAVVATCDMQLKSTGADPWEVVSLCAQRLIVDQQKAIL